MSKSITPLMDARLTAEGAERGRLKADAERDALVQRCRELEADLAEQASLLEGAIEQRDFLDKLQSAECFRREKAEVERDTLRAEVERLRAIVEQIQQIVTHPHESKEALANRVRQILEARQ